MLTTSVNLCALSIPLVGSSQACYPASASSMSSPLHSHGGQAAVPLLRAGLCLTVISTSGGNHSAKSGPREPSPEGGWSRASTESEKAAATHGVPVHDAQERFGILGAVGPARVAPGGPGPGSPAKRKQESFGLLCVPSNFSLILIFLTENVHFSRNHKSCILTL